jgi:hypothetical protein
MTRIKQTRAKPTKVLVRWVTAYMLDGKWETHHFKARRRARAQVRFWRTECTSRGISTIQIVRVAFEVKL